MKTKIKADKGLLLWLVLLISSSGLFAVEPDQSISEWNGNESFTFSEESEFLHVKMDKHPFESFSVKIQNVGKLEGNICNLKLRTSKDCFLKVDISNGEKIGHSDSRNFVQVTGSNQFTSLELDYTSFLEKNTDSDALYLIVYVDPGTSFNGSIDLQGVSFETKENAATATKLHIYPSPAKEFTVVTVPEGEFSKLTLIDANGRMVKTVNYDFSAITEYRFETSGFAAGVYTLSLEGKMKSLQTNLVIR